MTEWQSVEVGGTVLEAGRLFRKISGVFGVAEDGEYQPFGRWQMVEQIGKPPTQTQGTMFDGDDDAEN